MFYVGATTSIGECHVIMNETIAHLEIFSISVIRAKPSFLYNDNLLQLAFYIAYSKGITHGIQELTFLH